LMVACLKPGVGAGSGVGMSEVLQLAFFYPLL
jgi:hypothetical protein